MNPDKADDRRDLMGAVEHSRWKLEDIRCARRALIKRAVGSEWYPDGAEEDTPINQLAQAEMALVQHLIGGEPRALVVAGDSDFDATAYEQTLALNKLGQQMGLAKKLRRLVRDAIYGMGICRIGMTANKRVPIREIAPELDEEGEVGVGRMLLQVISLESWVHDCESDTLDERRFCGHAYWVDAEDIKGYLPGVSEKDLIEEEKRWIDEHGHETAGAISRGTEGEGQRPYGKKYWLWDLWLPRENVIITTQVNGTGEIANVRPWNSRPGGPYLFLDYRQVPDQAMPMSVLADLALVHDSLNSTLRKLIDQVREQKTVLGFKPGHEDDAERIRDAGTRAIMQMRDPSAVQEFNYNGPDQAILATLLQLRDLASIIGGNTDTLAGLGPQAPTLGQEQLIDIRANVRVQAMEQQTADFLVELFEAMRWYLYHEQVEPISIVKEVEGTDLRIEDEFSSLKAGDSAGRFDSFAMQIEPYSRVYRSPDERLKMLLEMWERLIVPGLQMGMTDRAPDMDRLVEIAAQYGNLPEVRSLLRYVPPEEQGMMGGGSEPRQSPVTTRNYVRHGAPGPNRQGQAMQAMQMMQQSERGT